MQTLRLIRNLLAALLLTCAAALGVLGQKPLSGHEGVYTSGDPRMAISYIDTCEFVFEGAVHDFYKYYDREFVFVCYNVKVHRVFRGDLDTGFVQVIRSEFKKEVVCFVPRTAADGVFFCSQNDIKHIKFPDSTWSRKPIQYVFKDWIAAQYMYDKFGKSEKFLLNYGQHGSLEFSDPESFMNYFAKCGTIKRSRMKNWTPLVRQDWWKLRKNPPIKKKPFVPYSERPLPPGHSRVVPGGK